MTFFIKRSNKWFITTEKEVDIHDKLEASNYILQFNSFEKKFYLIEN